MEDTRTSGRWLARLGIPALTAVAIWLGPSHAHGADAPQAPAAESTAPVATALQPAAGHSALPPPGAPARLSATAPPASAPEPTEQADTASAPVANAASAAEPPLAAPPTTANPAPEPSAGRPIEDSDEGPPADPPHDRKPLVTLDEPAFVALGRHAFYEVRVGSSEIPAAARAKRTERALARAIEVTAAPTVHIVESRDRAVIYAGDIVLMQLFPEDAAAYQDADLAVHAERVTALFGEHIRTERQRKTWAGRVFSVSFVVLISLIAVALLAKSGDATKNWRAWLESHRTEVPAIRVQSLELLGSAAVRSTAILILEFGKWLGRLLIVYLWLLVCLAQFETTRGVIEGLTGRLLQPLAAALERSALALPVLSVFLIAAVSIAALLRFLQLFFAGVARGEARLPWVSPEHAETVSQLLRVFVLLGAFLFIAPLLSGSDSGVLSRVGLLGLGAIALGGAPLVASALVGLVTVFGDRVTVGSEVRFGGVRGRVRELSLLGVTLTTETGADVRVPQLLALFHPTEQLTRGRSSLDVPVREPTAELVAAIEEAARAIDERAVAHVHELGVDVSTVRITLARERIDSTLRSRLLLAAADAVSSRATGMASGDESNAQPTGDRPA